MRRPVSEFWPTFWAWLVPAVTVVAVPLEVYRLAAHAGLTAPAEPKVWTEQELKDRFLMRSMDSIETVLGPASSANVDGAGNIVALHYQDFAVVNNTGKDRVRVSFHGKGNRCTLVAVPHK